MRRWRAGIVVMVTAGVLAGLVVRTATAGTPGTSPGNGSYVGGVVFPGPEPLVLWNLPGSGGKVGTCIDASVNGPLTGPYTRDHTVTDPLYAELNHLYASSATSDVQLAELSALTSRKYDQVDTAAQWGYVARGEGGLSTSDADSMLARASDLAGPYTVSVGWPSADTETNTDYTATVTVRSAKGIAVPGLTVRLTGSAVHLAAGTGTTGSTGVATVGFSIPTGTSATASITATVPQWTTLDVYRSSGEQTMVVTGEPGAAQGTHTAPVTRTRPITLVKVDAGDATRAPVAGYTFRITAADGAVVLPSVTTASTPVPLGPLTIGQTYHATETAVPAGATLYIPTQATTSFTVTAGTTPWELVIADPHVPRPALQTVASGQHAIVGQRLSDRVTVSGDDGEDGMITAHLFGPIAVPASGSCSDLTLTQYRAGAAQAFTASVHGPTGRGNGTVTIAGPVVTSPGCYGWAETLALTPSGARASSAPTAPHESSLVTRPGLRTTVSAQVASVGSTLSDTVTITGLDGQHAIVVARLYGPLPVTPADTGCTYTDAQWRAAVAHTPALLVTKAQTSLTGDGTLTLAPAVVRASGCYTYVETLTPRSTPGRPVQTAFAEATESSLVLSPHLGTQVSSQLTPPGASVRDAISVTGDEGVAATITGVLLGPIAPGARACSGLDWTRAKIAAVLTPLAVRHDGRYVSAPVRVGAAGCYTFAETLVVGGVPVAHSPAGQQSETVIVRSPAAPLAQTGFALTTWLGVGGGLVVLGGLGVVAGARGSRRRRWTLA